MTGLFNFVRSLHIRDFLVGIATGFILAGILLAGLRELGAFRSDSEDIILSADYRLSRTETELREEVRSLKSELDLLRRTRVSPVRYPGVMGF